MSERQSTDPPKYGSFGGFQDGKWSWPYKWQPMVGMGVQGGLGMATVYGAQWALGLNFWIAFVIGVVTAVCAGFLYNFLAKQHGWQRLHWIDVLLGIDPFMFP